LYFPILVFSNYKITQLPNYKSKGIHGEYDEVKQRRTQEIKAHRAQETQSRKTAQASRLSSRIEKAEGQEAGPRPGEAVAAGLHWGIPPFENAKGGHPYRLLNAVADV
jgi:hypothetical protein